MTEAKLKRELPSDGGETNRTTAMKNWWTVPDEDMAAAITATCDAIVNSASYRARMYRYSIALQLYGNQWATSSMAGTATLSTASGVGSNRQHMNDNIVQSCIDTLMSRIAQNKPRPEFDSVGGDYRIQKQAEDLNKFVEGTFYENKTYEIGNFVFRDGTALGDGFIHSYIDADDRVRDMRVAPMEILVDERESVYGFPRQMHWVHEVDRDVARACYPASADAIDAAPQAPMSNMANGQVSDSIIIRESWHLKSGRKATDGLHVISIETVTASKGVLVREEWDEPMFPFVRFHWCPRAGGYWSQGLPEQVGGLQIALNRINYTIEKSHNHMGSYKVLLQNGSKIVKEHLRSEIAAIISYSGTKPEFVTPQIVQAELYAFRLALIEEIRSLAGVSELSTSSKKPEGLDSEPSLREFYSIESDRFKTVIGYFENMFLDLARLHIALVKRAAGKGSYKVRLPSDGGALELDWRDVNLSEEQYVLQCFPVSMLPRSPEGKLKFTQELAQAGYIEPRQGKRLLMGIPDLDAERQLDTAPEDWIRKTLENIMYKGEYVPPDVFDNLPLARELALKYMAKGKVNGLEEERLEMYRRYLAQLDMLVAAAQPPPPPMGQSGAPAAPLPPPVSQLLPNAANKPPPLPMAA